MQLLPALVLALTCIVTPLTPAFSQGLKLMDGWLVTGPEMEGVHHFPIAVVTTTSDTYIHVSPSYTAPVTLQMACFNHGYGKRNHFPPRSRGTTIL